MRMSQLVQKRELDSTGGFLLKYLSVLEYSDDSAAQIGEYSRISEGGKPRPVHGRGRTRELLALVRVLRACVQGERNAPWFQDELLILENAVNENVVLKSEAFSEEGSYFVRLGGSTIRAAVQEMAHYTKLLASNPRLADTAPIAVCKNCCAIYGRGKVGQNYCSDKCRVARWSTAKGIAYFADAQRRRRAKAASEKKQRKSVVISEGELSAKRREMKGKPKTKR
jgi:hypothetical protein